MGPINSFVSIDMTPKMINNSEWSLGLIGSREFSDETGRRHLQNVLRQMRDNWQLSAQRVAQKIPSKSSVKLVSRQKTRKDFRATYSDCLRK